MRVKERTRRIARRGPRATYEEQMDSYAMRVASGRTQDDGRWLLPEKGRARRKRSEARARR